jgi:amino-acid N-acetyltransferase
MNLPLPPGVTIDRATARDLPDIFGLLKQHALPVEGLAEHLATALVARRDNRIIGSAAIEVYVGGGLLRSVAVDDAFRGQGLGQALTEAAFVAARNARVDTLYLLTTTAEQYFPKLGFERIPRDHVPAAVRTSVEFTSACCASATVMRKRLNA